MSAGLYLRLLIFIVFPKDITATNGTLGSLFVLALPRLTFGDNAKQNNITFHVATFSESPFEVTFQFVHNEGQGQDNQTKVISRGTLSTFVVNKSFWDERNLVRKGVFKVSGNGRFGLTVLMFGSNREMSTFTAVPVEAWGTEYFAVTLDFNPAVQIISADDPSTIEIHYMFRLYLTYDHPNYTFENNLFEGEKTIQRFIINSYEAISISDCQDTFEISSLSGTQISGDSTFGVVSGSCSSRTLTTVCLSDLGQRDGITSDPGTEMLAPTGHWGTEFIVMTIPDRVQQGCARVINAKGKNQVNMTSPDPTSIYRSVFFLDKGLWDVAIKDFNLRINSNHPIQVAYIQYSACRESKNLHVIGEPFGDPSICMLTPNNLFFLLYAWKLPDTLTKNYAALVSEKENCKFITLDDNPLPSGFLWQKVIETPKYAVGHLELPSGYHEVGSSSFKKFGCYFYGLEKEVMFMHPGGYQACDFTLDPTDGDLIDNDCDGSIDEEEADYSDDDDDGLIDEDTRKSPKVDGHWGEWEEWFCNPDCAHTKFVRIRHCNNPQPKGYGKPCVGDVTEFRHTSCQPEKILYCPEQKPGKHHNVEPTHRVCGFKRWGPNCTGLCTNCINDCQEHTGACMSCQRGYKNAAAGCGKVCDANEYGFDCGGSCLEKCGVDCVEREFGECPNKLLHLLVLLAVLPVCVLMIAVWSKCSGKSTEEHFVKCSKIEGRFGKYISEQAFDEQDDYETDLEETYAPSEDNKRQDGSVVRSIYSTKDNKRQDGSVVRSIHSTKDNKSQDGSVVRSIYSTKSNGMTSSVFGSNVDP